MCGCTTHHDGSHVAGVGSKAVTAGSLNSHNVKRLVLETIKVITVSFEVSMALILHKSYFEQANHNYFDFCGGSWRLLNHLLMIGLSCTWLCRYEDHKGHGETRETQRHSSRRPTTAPTTL